MVMVTWDSPLLLNGVMEGYSMVFQVVGEPLTLKEKRFEAEKSAFTTPYLGSIFVPLLAELMIVCSIMIL